MLDYEQHNKFLVMKILVEKWNTSIDTKVGLNIRIYRS